MFDEKKPRYRDDEGKLIGGTTAHAPGIHPGDDLETLEDATSAEEAAAALANRPHQQDHQPHPTPPQHGRS